LREMSTLDVEDEMEKPRVSSLCALGILVNWFDKFSPAP